MMNDEDLRQKSNLYFKGKLETFQTFNGNLSIPSDSVPLSGDASYFLRFNGTSTSVYLKHEEGVPKNFWQKCYKQSQDVETFQLISASSASFISVQKNCETVRELQTGFADIKKSVWEIGMGASWHSKCKLY